MKLKREWLEDLIFGSEASRRFTQDSPVLPDVWIEFGRQYCEDPQTRLDLLLTPYRDYTTATLAQTVVSDMKKERATAGWKARHQGSAKRPDLAFNQATVALKVYFDELLRVLLPRTPWWKDRCREPLPKRSPRSLSLKAQEVRKAMGRASKGQTTSAAYSVDLLWMIKVVGVILLAQRLPAEGRTAEEQEKQFKALTENGDAQIKIFNELMRARYPADGTDDFPLWLVCQNRRADPTVWRSTLAIKADAARTLFNVSCREMAWAIVDSGIDARHAAFRVREDENSKKKKTKLSKSWERESRVRATYDFTRVRSLLNADPEVPFASSLKGLEAKELRRGLQSGRALDWALLEPFLRIPHDESYPAPEHAHGTHVAGILAGDWRTTDDVPSPDEDLMGVCPDLRLYDLRVLNKEGAGDEFTVMAALQFIRYLNAHREQPVIHGVNLSLSIPHDVANYACGRTPICEECERVVASGVVVVAAAGNEGYMQYATPRGSSVHGYRSISISDPGNAEEVITVGATHRYKPHIYGVSYFSSRGPTGDGRVKPDLVAPGEKIKAPVPGADAMSKDGTSMAAPHVSGAAALLMARHRELLGDPHRVKKILCETATDLGRERYFQGNGMVDVLRAMQSV